MAKWAIKLGEHDISYRPRTNIKGKAFTYFLLEIPDEVNPEIHKKESSDTGHPKDGQRWILYIDGASSKEGSGEGLVLKR